MMPMINLFLLGLLLICLSVVSSQEDASSIRITNGTPAAKGEFPYMVGMLIPHGLGTGVFGMCGGSLIDATHVLTAAHCLDKHTEEELLNIKVFINQLTLNDNDQDPGKVITGLSGYKAHPNYDSRLWFHDVAILTLNETVTDIPFAKLPPRQSNLRPHLLGRIGTVMGWGTVAPGEGSSSTLLKADVKVINHFECSIRIQVPAVLGAHICAGSTFRPTGSQLGGGPCTGDSGGPLIVDGVLVGIVSSGTECGAPGSAVLYTATGFYWLWIRANSDISQLALYNTDEYINE